MNISSNPFHVGNSNQNEKKIGPLCLVCHGLPENAFQLHGLLCIDLRTQRGLLSQQVSHFYYSFHV